MTSGKPLSSRYASLGYTDFKEVPHPLSLLWLLCGAPGTGKSNLFQSCPAAYIINTDLSATVTPGNVAATMWPKRLTDGGIEDPEEGLVTLNWERVRDRRDILLDMASTNYPKRPRLVVVDTMTACLPLIRDWVVRNCVDLKISRAPATHFNDLHGPAAYDAIYTELVDFAVALHNAGYGVCYVAHLNQREVDMEGGGKRIMQSLVRVTASLFERLYPIFEMVAATDIVTVTETIPGKEQTIKGSDGKILRVPAKDQTVTAKRFGLVVDGADRPKLSHILKKRVKLQGIIELPERDTWATFERAYTEAASL